MNLESRLKERFNEIPDDNDMPGRLIGKIKPPYVSRERIMELYGVELLNREKLSHCPAHRFNPAEEIRFGEKLICANCGGRMTGPEVFQYVSGFKAAGGDPNTVLPGWK